jgi:hypothetical protein
MAIWHSRRRLHPTSRSAAPLHTSTFTAPHASYVTYVTSTEENGSVWAAQRLGGSLAVGGLRELGASGSQLRARPCRAALRGLQSQTNANVTEKSRGSAERDTGLRRTGRLAKVAGFTGELWPRTPPLGARDQIAVVAAMAIWHERRRLRPISRSAAPLLTSTSTVPYAPCAVCGDVYGGERLGMGSTAIGGEPSRRWS